MLLLKQFPFFHPFTGCDTVSAFYGIGKKKAWNVWEELSKSSDVLDQIFIDLTSRPESVSADQKSSLEKYVASLYYPNSGADNIDKCRELMILQKVCDPQKLPPASSALFYHIKRAVYQAGYVWSQCLSSQQTLLYTNGDGR